MIMVGGSPMPRRALLTIPLLIFGIIAIPAMSATTSAETDLERRFTQTVRPFLASYCIGCHAGETPAAQFDLRRYSTMAAVVRDHPRWVLVLDKLATREMPPKQVKQPAADTRQKVIDWIEAVRKNEARKNAGDPGLVLARRLSNAEYNYTIRDLTGVDLRPAREFPVDPANPAGFDNSGESLSMSPALLSKYLQAAREVSNHMVLKPEGIAFAPHPMLVETDREKYAIQRIVDFYDRQPTDYADYFRSAWRFKHRAFFGKPRATLAGIAAENKVSAKYLATIWRTLEQTKEDVGPLVKLQAMWQALPAPTSDQPDLTREGCVRMRDFVVQLRNNTTQKFSSPMVQGLNYTSQPLMNWKLRAFATHRRDFDRSALRVEGEPPPVEPEEAPFRGTRADRAANEAFDAARIKGRREDPNLLVPAGERARYETAFARFSSVFPNAFYIRERGRFYPDDSRDKGRLLSAGFHNVMGYFRDDIPLIELVLDDKEQKELETLWREFDFIADFTIRTFVQFYFNNSGEVRGLGVESGNARPSDKEVTSEAIINGLREAYLAKAEPSGNPIAMQAIDDHFQRVNSAIRSVERARPEAEPRHFDALLNFAARAYRRPLSQAEPGDMLAYYRSLREKSGLTHEEAMRDSIAGVLMSPDFCYRIDLVDARPSPPAPAAAAARPLSNYALASRLSYFLWSSMPDEQLLAHAAAGDLRKPDVLVAQTRRMLKDDRALGLAIEFAGNWLDFRRFEENNTVDRQRFPSFNNELRQAMFEEPVRFIADVIRNDRSVLDLLYGNHTFVNPVLARHYGMPEITGSTDEWVRVEDARRYGRGGLLPMSVFLTQNAPGLRTSPVKRGYWIARRVLGEAIPPPPAVVPELPHDEAKLDLPLREMLARHRADPACAGCHARFDSFGLAFEGYGPVGERRTKDLAGRPVDVRAAFPGGSQGTGFEGLQSYIRAHREKDFIDNLSRKMLVYALGRSLTLSDEPTMERMRTKLTTSGYRFTPLVETVVTSPQFLTKRSPDLQQLKR